MRSSVAISIAAVILHASVAYGQGKGRPLAGSTHNPPVFVDEPTLWLTLLNRSDAGYAIKAHVEVSGATSRTDLLRIDWRQKGKVVASAKCKLDIDTAEKYASGDCDYDPSGNKPLVAKGPVDAELIYWDDQQEKEYLVRTLKVNVGVWKERGKQLMYQIVPDDVLAAAWIHHGGKEAVNSGVYRRPVLYLWFASDKPMPNAAMRCTAAGKKLEDFELSPGSGGGEVEADHIPEKGERLTYEWEQQRLTMDIFWGPKSELKDWAQKGQVLADNPGKWECGLRVEGKTLRQISFTVDKDGMIQQDEIQSGKGAIPTVPGVVLVDLRIPKDAGWDVRIRPDAMKKSMGYGLPWPSHAKVKTIHASYPGKSGYPDPK